jgi:Xaa-Pro aminopeptidase
MLPQISRCTSETEVAGKLNGLLQEKTPFGQSFPSIIASGINGTILHYTKNNDPLDTNELILLDFGARWQGMTADISRTVPLSGKFNPLQRLLYTLVLDTQTFVESQVKAGTKLADINQACWEYMNQELDLRFTQKGGKMNRPYTKAPHNVSHLIGLQVHDGDPFRDYKNIPLKAGTIISNEPGLYGHFEITLDGVFYSSYIGIRIEDDLWITDTGCINLSTDCPKLV